MEAEIRDKWGDQGKRKESGKLLGESGRIY